MNKLRKIPLGFTYAICILAIVPGIGFYYCKMYGKQNSWLALIISNILGFIFVKMIITIRNYDKEKNIFEINKIALGKILGTLVNSLFCLVFSLLISVVCWHSYIFLKSYFFDQTPFFILGICSFVPILFISTKTNNVLLRCNQLFFVLVFVLWFAAFFGLVFQIDLKNLEPFQEVKTLPLLYNIFAVFSVAYLPTYVVAALSNFENKKGIFKSILLTAFINTSIVFSTYAVLGKSIIEMVDFSEFFVLRRIGDAIVSSRIDSFIILEWLICVYSFSACGLFYIRNFLKSEFKGFKNKYIFIIVLILSLTSSHAFKNVTIGKNFIEKILPFICFSTLFLLNLIIFIILRIKKKPITVSHNEQQNC